MEHLPPNEFVTRIARGWDPKMNTSIYDGLGFRCACGESHPFDSARTTPLVELSGMRLVVKCPTSHHVTCIKVPLPAVLEADRDVEKAEHSQELGGFVAETGIKQAKAALNALEGTLAKLERELAAGLTTHLPWRRR